MSDERSKRKMVERYLRAADKHLGYEELKRRKAQRAQRGTPTTRDPRRRDWAAGEDEWDDGAGFEKIGRSKPGQRRASTTGAASGPIDESLARSTVIAVHRGRVVLEDDRPGRLAGALAADPNLQIVVGDEVAWSDHEGVARIEAVCPRRTRLFRTDPGNPHRELVIAANVDLAVIVVAAANPPLRPGLIDRILLALERSGVEPAICVNKVDLLEDEGARSELEDLLAPYRELEASTHLCSAEGGQGLEGLREELAGKTCVFVGHSGVGKSSILNALDPDGERGTGDVRAHDGRGRHTTTSSSLRSLGQATRVIDTPGVRSFGLERLEPRQILAGFPELEALGRGCRFNDCTHVREPDCAVREANPERYASYLRMLED